MNTKKVLLIDPEGKSSGPNVALAYISSYLKAKDIQVTVLDFNNTDEKTEVKNHTLLEAILKHNPSWIGYSLFYTNVKWAINQVRFIRKHFQGKIVVGGPQAILEQEDLLKDVSEIDVLSFCEGEELSYELTEAISHGYPLDNIKGIAFRNDKGEIIKNEARPLLKEIDTILFPDFSFYERGLEYYPVITSRGCPYNCAYCFRAFKHDWRPRTPQNVISEILNAKEKYNINKFVFHDDTLNLKPARVVEICRLILRSNIKISWTCAGIRADSVNQEMADMMFKAGCGQVNIGIETFDEEIFNTINKRESLNDIVQGIRIIQKSGIKVTGYLIIGLPGDTYAKTMETMKKAANLNLNQISWTIFLPIPKTVYYDILKKDPRVKWLHDYRDIDMVWLPRMKQMGVSFEYPEFTAKEKIRAYRTVNAYLLSPLSHHHGSIIKYLLNTHYEMIRYAPLKIMSFWIALVRKTYYSYQQGLLRNKLKTLFK